MNFKRYNESDNSWTDSHYIKKTDTDIITTLPATIYPLGQTATIGLKGNTVQNGTPTPENPVPVVSVGDLDNGQYKIPISSGGTTTTEYLGQVQSTRQIKKWVLDGKENWQFTTYPYCTFITDYLRTKRLTCVCSHLQAVSNINIGDSIAVNTCCFLVDNYAFYYKDTSFSSVTDFKTYLQQEYAAGTPVTVWYVLATPQTAVVNEPLMKIGTYADSISGISIPTTAGANTLDVDTTVAPSEVTASYSGWHPVSAAHERENGAWT